MGTSHGAQFEIALEPEDLLERAREWVRRRDSAIGAVVNQSLTDYLSGDGIDPAEHARRLDAFRAALRNGINTAKPLIAVDPVLNGYFHDESRAKTFEVMTPLPFPRNHPARAVVAEVLHHLSEQELEKYFDDSTRQRVDITSYLDAPVQPMVLSSLVGPIADEWVRRRESQGVSGFWQWRRARPLRDAVPVDPDVRKAMVRGWFVARLLDLINMDAPRNRAVTILDADGGELRFPFPLLGPPIARADDVLPAVLETMGIAIVLNPKDSLRSYARLASLGAAVRPVGLETVPQELDQWLREGSTVEGHPTPAIASHAPDASRAGRDLAVDEFLRRYTDHYVELESLDVSRLRGDRSRAWEIAQEVVQELYVLREAIQSVPDGAAAPGGIG
jgi:hypothetical protein